MAANLNDQEGCGCATPYLLFPFTQFFVNLVAHLYSFLFSSSCYFLAEYE